MKHTLRISVGECIRRLRIDAGMSQVVFGERCGFYQTYVSRVERGLANPTLNALDVIATTLGLSVFEFFREVEREHFGLQSRQT